MDLRHDCIVDDLVDLMLERFVGGEVLVELQMIEAQALVAELGIDLDTLASFWRHLRQRESLLTDEECAAATSTIEPALAG